MVVSSLSEFQVLNRAYYTESPLPGAGVVVGVLAAGSRVAIYHHEGLNI